MAQLCMGHLVGFVIMCSLLSLCMGGRTRADAAEQSTGHASLPEESCMQCLPGSSTVLEAVCAQSCDRCLA